jgi:HD-like signal output (HDOD) protein
MVNVGQSRRFLPAFRSTSLFDCSPGQSRLTVLGILFLTLLIDNVSRNLSFPNRSLSEAFSEKLLNSYEIRPFPQVVVKLIEALRDPNISLVIITQIVLTDAALCAKVLRMANSPLIGAGQRVTQVDHAITILGFNRIKGLAQIHAAAAVIAGDGSFLEVRQSLWRHSLACATACRAIAQQLNVGDPALAFLAGVFHDIGHIFFLDIFGDSYVSIRNTFHPLKSVEPEQTQLGMNHQQAGMKLTLAWGLPESVRIGVGFHHRPEQAIAYADYAWIVFLADRLVHGHGIGSTMTTSVFQADFRQSPFDVPLERFKPIRAQVVEEFQEFQQAFS